MNLTNTKRWRPPPLVVVLATTALTLTALLGIGWLNARRYRVKARVEIAEPVIAGRVETLAGNVQPGSLPNGEVERMALRVREVTGLLYGLTLLAVTEQMNRRQVSNVQALLQLLAQRNLLPPGIQSQPAAGACTTTHATLYVRYCSQPLGLEVVSVGHERLDGPSLIGRLSAGGTEQTGVLLLIAKPSANANIPAPFASLEQIIALGWQMEPLREHAGATTESDQLQQWARQYAASQ